MVFPSQTWILLLAALLFCSLCLYRFPIYQMAGNALGTAGITLIILILALSRGTVTVAAALLCLLCLVYGVETGALRFLSELGSGGYRRLSRGQEETPLWLKITLWLIFSLGTLMQMSPLWYRVSREGAGSEVMAWIGILIMLGGLILMGMARRQAQAAQASGEKMPPMAGLYRISRFPVQMGAFLFWIGLFVSGTDALRGWQWIIAIVGLAGVLLLIVAQVRYLEKKQNRKFGDRSMYQMYVEKTPVLLPFLPIHTLQEEE